MAQQQKAFRYRLLPTSEQERLFQQYAGARRWVYNWALARRKAHYAATGETLTVRELCAELTLLKQQPETAWLRSIQAQSLQQAVRDLDRAFGAFFARRARFPRFRSKKRGRPSFRLPQFVRLDGARLLLPKLGSVRLVLHRPLEGSIKSASISQDATGAWYVSLLTQFELPDTPLPPPLPERSIGVDLGLKDLAVLSDGRHIAAPKHYRRAERKLRRLQRQLSRCLNGGRNRERVRQRLARQHRRVANQRRDFLHKLSAALVGQHEAVVIEELAVSALARTKQAKSVLDAGWATLRVMLGYKARWQRKHLALVGRYCPSSRLCRECGRVNAELRLGDRSWSCECGAVHERDENAAETIRIVGLRLLLAGGTPDSHNASRELVSPGTSGLGSPTEEAAPQAVR